MQIRFSCFIIALKKATLHLIQKVQVNPNDEKKNRTFWLREVGAKYIERAIRLRSSYRRF